MNIINTILSIGVGATIGASIRYYINFIVVQIFHKEALYATLTANIIGCFMAGFIIFAVIEKANISELYKLLLLIGLAGSLSTLAALSIESINMIINGNYLKAFINIFANIVLSLSATFLAIMLAKYLF